MLLTSIKGFLGIHSVFEKEDNMERELLWSLSLLFPHPNASDACMHVRMCVCACTHTHPNFILPFFCRKSHGFLLDSLEHQLLPHTQPSASIPSMRSQQVNSLCKKSSHYDCKKNKAIILFFKTNLDTQ